MKYIFFKPRETDGNFLLSVVMMTAKMLFFVVLLLGVAGSGLLLGIAKAWVDTTPQLDLEAVHAASQTSFIYDKYGNLITEYKGNENRIDVSLGEVSPYIQRAVVAVEDARFYSHNGVDLRRIAAALVGNLSGGRRSGASTITCQLIKLKLLSTEQTYKRKMQEAYLALQLEKVMTKNEILEDYLNAIYMGGSSYGVQIAAQDYFGKDARNVTLREAAALARIIRSPNTMNPRSNYYKWNTPEKIEEGTDYVLQLMLEQQLITQEEYDQAMSERLTVLKTSTAASDAMYDNAYYVEYAIYDVITKMLRVEGLEDTKTNRSQMERKLRTGGYYIYTCLDPEIQQSIQNVVTEWRSYPSMRYRNDRTIESSLGGGSYIEVVQPQAAAAVVDWHTGELVAIIGGRSEPVQKLQLNRAYQNNMPVGSSIKPLSVYGPAFDMGYSPGTPVLNMPIPIKDWVSERKYPQNYGGGQYTGVETLRRAVNQSHNTSTAHALMDYVGIENSVYYLLRLGVGSQHILATGSGLALGSSGLTVIEEATAYGAIANLGEYLESYAFSRVLNADGSTYISIYDVQIRRQAFKQSTACMLVDVLVGCINTTGSSAKFAGMNCVGKTGTNSNNIGVTFAGMTPYFSAAVWIGSDRYKPLSYDTTGGGAAAPLWSRIMQTVHRLTGKTQNKDIISKTAEEVDIVKCTVCAVSGLLPTNACRSDINGYGTNTDYYLNGTQPTTYCNMHRAIEVCRESGRRATSACPSTRVVGVIYVPEGHPLRYAKDIDDVREYFSGASYDADYTSIRTCHIHG